MAGCPRWSTWWGGSSVHRRRGHTIGVTPRDPAYARFASFGGLESAEARSAKAEGEASSSPKLFDLSPGLRLLDGPLSRAMTLNVMAASEGYLYRGG